MSIFSHRYAMSDYTVNPLPASPVPQGFPPVKFGGGVSRRKTEGVNNLSKRDADSAVLPLTRLLLRLALLLISAFTGIVLVIHLLPYDDSELRAFLLRPAGCPAPCWQGIRPGVTTAEEAKTILQSHPWVGYINDTSWQWSSKAPLPAGLGKYWNSIWINSDNHIVEAVTLATDLSWGAVWLMYGQPTSIKLEIVSLSSVEYETRYFTGWHSEDYLMTHVAIPCEPNYEPFWKAQVFSVLIGNDPLTPSQDSGYMLGFPLRDVFEFLDLDKCY